MATSSKGCRWYEVRRGFLWGVLGLLLVVAGACHALGTRQGRGPAGGPLERADFSVVWSEERTVLVGLGDSVVTGFGARQGWGLLERLVRVPEGDDSALKGCDLSSVYPKLEVLNLAENSSNSAWHLGVQLPRVPVMPEGVKGLVVLSTGGIDLIHDYGSGVPREGALYGAELELGLQCAASFERRLDRIFDGLRERFPSGCEIYVMTIFDPTDGVGDIENVGVLLRLIRPLPAWPDGLRIHAAFNQAIRNAAASRSWVHVVDVHRLMLGHGLHHRDERNPHYDPADPHYWYYVNLEDPNERGYDAIRREFLRVMAGTRAH